MSKGHRVDLTKLERRATAAPDPDKAVQEVQDRLLQIQQAYLLQGRRAVILFEGTDAAGKGGTIRRLTSRLDPRFCHVWPISAPNAVEARLPYLARFVARLPEPGSMAVFDRSWYGRLLVERVEKLIARPDWKRAFREIPAFERMIIDDGMVLVKIYLHISAEEQAERFLDRLTDPYKRWKITLRDFEARGFYDSYRKAAEEAIERTWTDRAPWHVIAASDKPTARLQALTTIADRLAEGVDLSPPKLDPELKRLAKSVLGAEIG